MDDNNKEMSLDMSKFLNSQLNIKINNQEEYELFLEELQLCGVPLRKGETYVYDAKYPIYFIIPFERYMVKFPEDVVNSYKNFTDLELIARNSSKSFILCVIIIRIHPKLTRP